LVLPEKLVVVGRESAAHPAFSNGIKLKACRITDARDYERYVDYTHYNPVKHCQVARVADLPYSSFQRYVRCGIYNLELAADDDVRRLEMLKAGCALLSRPTALLAGAGLGLALMDVLQPGLMETVRVINQVV
jgi:hypothetical protein